MNLKRIKRKKLLERNSIIQKYSELLEKETQRTKFAQLAAHFRNHDATWLVAGICERKEFTCELVIKVFIWSAIQAHEQTNCLTEVMFEEAIRTAKMYDEDYARTGTRKGALHGIPISIKDNLAIKGYDCTLGLVANAFRPCTQNNAVVDAVIAAGAIPFVKTNVPQTLLSFECSNYLWGATVNPVNAKYSPGGSSGGEAALIAAGGSIVGLGNDVGGSLRIPAHFCGIYSLKPTYGRVSSERVLFAPLQECIRAVNGPMANSMANLEILSQVLIDSYDELPKMAWRPFSLGGKRLRVGKIPFFGPVKSTSSCSRALLEVEARLKDAGIEVTKLTVSGIEEGICLFYQLMSADGFVNFRKAIGKERIEPHLKPLFDSLRVPSLLRRFCIWMYERCGGSGDFSRILRSCSETSVGAVWQIQQRIHRYQKNIRRQLADARVDCIICPAFASPATKLNTFSFVSFCAIYTFIWNIVDVPVGVIPVTMVNPAIDAMKIGKQSILSGFDYGMNLAGLFCVEDMANLPVGIQVIAPNPFEEEKLLYCMQFIDSLVKKSNKS